MNDCHKSESPVLQSTIQEPETPVALISYDCKLRKVSTSNITAWEIIYHSLGFNRLLALTGSPEPPPRPRTYCSGESISAIVTDFEERLPCHWQQFEKVTVLRRSVDNEDFHERHLHTLCFPYSMENMRNDQQFYGASPPETKVKNRPLHLYNRRIIFLPKRKRATTEKPRTCAMNKTSDTESSVGKLIAFHVKTH